MYDAVRLSNKLDKKNVKQSLNISMKFQIPKAQNLSGKLAGRTFQFNMLAEIMLIEKDKMLLKNGEVAKEINQYFGHTIDSLDLYGSPYEKVFYEGLGDIDNIVCKFRNHPSIKKVKE